MITTKESNNTLERWLIESMAADLAILKDFVAYQEIGLPEAARILNVNERVLRRQTSEGRRPNIPGVRPYRFIKLDLIRRRTESSWPRINSISS